VGFEFHCVLAVHSAHLIAQGAAEADRWLPVLWALDQFKEGQQRKRDKNEGAWVLPLADSAKLPLPGEARRRYLDAMAAWDEEAADRAITALVRTTGPEAVRDLIFRHGARDFRDIGHKAIYAANAWRTLKVIGGQHAEPVLRSLTFACLEHDGKNPGKRDAAEDRPWREDIIALHAVTSMNALHYAYQTVAETESRLLMLLQGAAFLALFRDELGSEPRGPGVDTLKAGEAGLGEATAAARSRVMTRGDGAHDYKLGAAVLEDVQHLSPRWRSRYLTANLGLIPGAHEPVNPLCARIRAALAV
jgi:hypothetical protein